MGWRSSAPILCRSTIGFYLQLSDGRRLKAQVIRVFSGHFGLKLESPLASDDPLFSAGAQLDR